MFNPGGIRATELQHICSGGKASCGWQSCFHGFVPTSGHTNRSKPVPTVYSEIVTPVLKTCSLIVPLGALRRAPPMVLICTGIRSNWLTNFHGDHDTLRVYVALYSQV